MVRRFQMNCKLNKYWRKAIVVLALVICILASTAVPTLPSAFMAKTVVAGTGGAMVAAGKDRMVGMRSDGTVLAAGPEVSVSEWDLRINEVVWKTNRVSLEADDFQLMANGQIYYANVEDVEIHSDPGDEDYCTLEVTWHEHGVEMRLYMYFYADSEYWWSDEIRTYNGQPQGDWIYYYGDFFRSRLSNPFIGDIELQCDPNNDYIGSISFSNLRLQAFLPLPVTWEFSHGLNQNPSAVFHRHYDGIEVALSDLTPPEEVVVIWFYDEVAWQWKWYKVGWTESTLETLEYCNIYVIIVMDACTWEIQ